MSSRRSSGRAPGPAPGRQNGCARRGGQGRTSATRRPAARRAGRTAPGRVYSRSKPWSSNFSVRLFSVTVRTTWSGAPPGNVGLDLQRHPDVAAHEAGEMADHFVGDPARVAAGAGRIERHAAVEAGRGRGAGRFPNRRSRSWSRDWRSRSSVSSPRWPPTLHFVGLRVRRTGGVRRRQADHQQAVAGRLHRFGQRLRERELRLEAARRQVAPTVELARVGDPLVDQDQARPVLDEKLPQDVAGAGRYLPPRERKPCDRRPRVSRASCSRSGPPAIPSPRAVSPPTASSRR